MRPHLILVVIALGLGLSHGASAQPASATPQKPLLLVFGSCLRQQAPQPVWKTLRALAPDLLVLGGDNVYSDVGSYLLRPEPARIGRAYAELAANADWAALRATVPVYATWDDHDYGRNDGGADYPHKAASKEYFMSFFGIVPTSPMRRREGVYDAHWITHDGRRIQLLLLDTRSFRSPLVAAGTDADCPRRRWGQNDAPEATMLGAAQWAWLGAQLREPADLHLLVSSIQVIPDSHCYEKWSNFPRERARLLDEIDGASAPVLILSGDRHLGEISRLPEHGKRHWPLLELTSSGLNSAGAGEGERNRYRAMDENVRVDNFATLEIRRSGASTAVGLALRASEDGRVLQQLDTRFPDRR